MHDGTVCLEKENFGCQICEGPESQGSTRMVKVADGGDGSAAMAEKVSRKVLSPLSFWTESAITATAIMSYQDGGLKHRNNLFPFDLSWSLRFRCPDCSILGDQRW